MVKARGTPATPEDANPQINVDSPGTFETAVGYAGTAGGTSPLPGTHSIPNYFWYAATPRVSLEVSNDAVMSARFPDAPRATGFGDTTVGSYVVLLHERVSRTPKLYVSYHAKLPSARSDSGLGSGFVDHSSSITVEKGFGRTRLSVAVSEIWLGSDGAFATLTGVDGGAIITLTPAAAESSSRPAWYLVNQLGLTGKVAGSPRSAALSEGVRVQLLPAVSLAGGVRLGLTGKDTTPRFGTWMRVILGGSLR